MRRIFLPLFLAVLLSSCGPAILSTPAATAPPEAVTPTLSPAQRLCALDERFACEINFPCIMGYRYQIVSG